MATFVACDCGVKNQKACDKCKGAGIVSAQRTADDKPFMRTSAPATKSRKRAKLRVVK